MQLVWVLPRDKCRCIVGGKSWGRGGRQEAAVARSPLRAPQKPRQYGSAERWGSSAEDGETEITQRRAERLEKGNKLTHGGAMPEGPKALRRRRVHRRVLTPNSTARLLLTLPILLSPVPTRFFLFLSINLDSALPIPLLVVEPLLERGDLGKGGGCPRGVGLDTLGVCFGVEEGGWKSFGEGGEVGFDLGSLRGRVAERNASAPAANCHSTRGDGAPVSSSRASLRASLCSLQRARPARRRSHPRSPSSCPCPPRRAWARDCRLRS